MSLAFWQWSRAAEKQALERRAAAPAVQVFVGQWLPAHTLYLDHRTMQGRQGFYVFTPFQVSEQAFYLVQRGWIARDFQDRKRLQPVRTPSGEQRLRASVLPEISQLQSSGLMGALVQDDPAEWPIVQSVKVPALMARVQQTQAALRDFKGVLRQENEATPSSALASAESDGLLRDWSPLGLTASKHQAYAFQWLCLALAALFLYGFFVRRQWRTASHPASPYSI